MNLPLLPVRNRQQIFSPDASAVLRKAQWAAAQFGHSYVGSEHLLLALTQQEQNLAAQQLVTCGISFASVQAGLLQQVGTGLPNSFLRPCMTPRLSRIIQRAAAECRRLNQRSLHPAHLLLGLLSEPGSLTLRLLETQNTDPTALYRQVLAALGDESTASSSGRGRIERDSSADTRLIEQFSRDMIQQALLGQYDPVIGRESEINRCMQILIRRSKNNPLLLGDPGVGKTAVVEGLALLMAAKQVPEALQGKRLLSLDLSSLVAGTKYRGEFEDRVKNVLREVHRAGNIILFLDEMHTIVGAGAAEGAIDASNIFKPALSRGELQMIGATTREEFRKHIEKDAALERRFQPVSVEEPTCETTMAILRRLKPRYELHHQISISKEALEAAVQLSHRYIPARRLPDKAIDLIDEAASGLRMDSLHAPHELKRLEEKLAHTFQEKELAMRSHNLERVAILRSAESDFRQELEEKRRLWKAEQAAPMVTAESIAKVLSQWTGIPAASMTAKEKEYLLHLEETLHRRVSGQDTAIRAISDAIRRGRTGLNDPKRPTGTFLFLGPTGVGKTELSKALAQALFGTEDALLRFDMTEYAEAHSISRLLGSPPGYVGFDEGGQLTERVRRRPYSVILFDELEKAHSDIWSILLQIMEDGILTDARGTRIDFRSSVLILTSNTGAEKYKAGGVSLGFSRSESNEASRVRETVLTELRRQFRPEFLNRLDEIVLFEPLGDAQMEEITHRLLLQITQRLRAQGISFHYDEASVSHLAQLGFDRELGARPLRRLLQTQVETPIARLLLEEQLSKGSELSLTLEDGALQLRCAVGIP